MKVCGPSFTPCYVSVAGVVTECCNMWETCSSAGVLFSLCLVLSHTGTLVQLSAYVRKKGEQHLSVSTWCTTAIVFGISRWW